MTVVSFITNKILSTNNHSPPYYDPWMIEINNLAERIKKDERDKLDKESISRGMKLVLIAVDEYEQGNESIALDIYLTGVDKIIMALPNKTDTKMAIKEKLLILKERIDKDKFGLMSSRDPIKKVMSSTDKDPILQFKQLGQSVVSGSVRLAVLIKQSPIPDLVNYFFHCFFQFSLWIDREYDVMNRAKKMGIKMIKIGLKVDQKYHLHEILSESLYTMMTAILKAVIVFKES